MDIMQSVVVHALSTSFSIIIDEDHLINLMIEDGIGECADG